MIKSSTGTIPKIEGLEAAIHKKWGTTPLQMDKAPRMYVQDVRNDTATNSIPQAAVESQAGDFVSGDGIVSTDGENGAQGEKLSLGEYSESTKTRVRSAAKAADVISAMPESAESKVYSMLAGGVNNSVAEEIANTPALAAAFEKMTGVKLEGTMSHKRATVKNNASLLVSDYRTKNSESVAQAVRLAWFENASEPMIDAVGDFGGAIYQKVVGDGVRSTAIRTGGVDAHQQFNIEFGNYYLDGYRGTGFAYREMFFRTVFSGL